MESKRERRPAIGVAAGFARSGVAHVAGERHGSLNRMQILDQRAVVRNAHITALEDGQDVRRQRLLDWRSHRDGLDLRTVLLIESDDFVVRRLSDLTLVTGLSAEGWNAPRWQPALQHTLVHYDTNGDSDVTVQYTDVAPGPDIFDADKHPEQAVLVGSIFVTFVLANLLLIPIGLAAIRTGSMLIRIPRRILLPAIVLFCIVGSYAMYGSYFDVWVMLAMGLLGLVLEKYGVPLGPVVLGIILGSQVEHMFIQCITKSSSLAAFFASPLSIGLGLISVALWLGPALLSLRAQDVVTDRLVFVSQAELASSFLDR